MTYREFAERVLFSDSLAEKLAPPPADLEDVRRGEAISTPEGPGRPSGLALRRDGVRAGFPGEAGIEDDEQRGRLLHFFANHELLASELMALVLLKFPDAPAEFREGILRTLKEEQMHTKLYLRRMGECGVEFGELPLNGFFWNAVGSMSTPLDYVTRLSLTFEQANLDYARGYAARFAEAGDAETAGILERIYRDEIGHVHYGLEWFRRWKERGQSDWQAFRSRLVLPLSPARAKGRFEFNEEGRRAAGLDEQFIRELKVYAQSRGRTPNVFWFNPGAEESLVPGGGESGAAQQVARDLALLPAFLARGEDVVMVPELPPLAYRTRLHEAGLTLPELVPWAEVDRVAERKLHELRPWACTPDAAEQAGLFSAPFQATLPRLFSKAEHATLLASLLEGVSSPLLADEGVVGAVVHEVEELERWLREAGEDTRCVIKAPWSTAGRARIIRPAVAPLHDDERAWVEDTVRRQGCVVVERWLERVHDFSIQYDRTTDGSLRRRGLVSVHNTPNGQFRSATVHGRFTDGLDPELRRLLFAGASKRGHLVEILEEVLEPGLERWLARGGYHGPLGVDAFFYRDDTDALRLKPVVEINPRFTMGRVALELARASAANSPVTFAIGKAKAVPEGALRLTPEGRDTRFAAWVDHWPAPGS